MSAMNLVRKTTVQKPLESPSPLDPNLERKLKSRKNEVVRFFKNNPLPISSNLGRKIILQAGIGKCQNTKDEIIRYEKYCSAKSRYGKHKSTKWPEIVKKSKKKKQQYFHKYTFPNRYVQRVKRQVELTIGKISLYINYIMIIDYRYTILLI